MFPNTQWTEVHGAMTPGGTIDPRRIEALCASYYKPVAAFIRSICPQWDDAEDLTQGFMAGLAQGKYIARADPKEGRFRSFLCQCARNFARSEWRRRAAIGRGGAAVHVPFDDAVLEATAQPAVEEFDRAWVGVVVERTMDALRNEHERHGNKADFSLLVEGLGWSGTLRKVPELAAEYGTTANAFTTAVSRLKRRFKEQIRSEVRRVVVDDKEVEAELRYYLSLFPDIQS